MVGVGCNFGSVSPPGIPLEANKPIRERHPRTNQCDIPQYISVRIVLHLFVCCVVYAFFVGWCTVLYVADS